jgi:hypothetical protein
MIIVASEPLTDQLYAGPEMRSALASPFVHTENSGKAKISNSPSSHSIYIITNRYCPLRCMRALREAYADGYAYALLVCTLDLAFK